MHTILRKGAALGRRFGGTLFGKSPTPGEIEAGFRKHGAWMTRFRIGDRDYGGNFNFMYDERLKWFYEVFPDVSTILELGSLEGGQSFRLAQQPGVQIVAIESRDYNIEKARHVQKLLNVKNVKFVQVDLEKTPLASFGRFDAVLCCGLLYHLSRPWEVLDGLKPVTRCVYVGTHYAAENKVTEVVNGFPGHWYQEQGYADPMSGMSNKSFWITLPSLIGRLKHNGFNQVKVLADSPEAPNGPFVILAAWVGE
jgi:SAM-dependent methyltransferase